MKELEMKSAYPTFIKQSGKDFLVFVPDWEIYTEGSSFVDAINMARDAIGLSGIVKEDDGIEFPEMSSYEDAIAKAKADADEDFDFSTGILTMVDVDFVEYRRQNERRSVKKNCTIPYWLNIEAERANINFSKVLQEALMVKLGVSR